MKIVVSILVVLFLTGCATKVPYTTKLKKEFNLSDDKLDQVQFFTSKAIILERSDKQNEMTMTNDNGELVTSSVSSSDRIVIPANSPCVFERVEDDGTVVVRFERGGGRVIRFSQRNNISNGRFYLKAAWGKDGKGELDYAGSIYYAVRGSGATYLLVKLKNYRKNKQSSRVVNGMKVK